MTFINQATATLLPSAIVAIVSMLGEMPIPKSDDGQELGACIAKLKPRAQLYNARNPINITPLKTAGRNVPIQADFFRFLSSPEKAAALLTHGRVKKSHGISSNVAEKSKTGPLYAFAIVEYEPPFADKNEDTAL